MFGSAPFGSLPFGSIPPSGAAAPVTVNATSAPSLSVKYTSQSAVSDG